MKWQDRGEDVGVVETPTMLFTAPSAASAPVGPLSVSDQLVLVPPPAPQPAGNAQPAEAAPAGLSAGWVQGIDLATGRQGWVRSARLQIHYTARRNAEVTSFSDQNTGAGDPPILTVYNDSAKPVYLHISGLSEIDLPPESSRQITLQSGIYTFNGASPDVMPTFGHYEFLQGDRCAWTYTILHNTAYRSSGKPIDPALTAEAARLQKDLDASAPALKIQAQKITDDEAAAKQAQARWQADATADDAKRASVDQSNQASVDAFNQSVQSANAELAAARTLASNYDAEVAAYNSEANRLNAERDRLRQIQQIINTSNH